jgi:hypothetical protein
MHPGAEDRKNDRGDREHEQSTHLAAAFRSLGVPAGLAWR